MICHTCFCYISYVPVEGFNCFLIRKTKDYQTIYQAPEQRGSGEKLLVAADLDQLSSCSSSVQTKQQTVCRLTLAQYQVGDVTPERSEMNFILPS